MRRLVLLLALLAATGCGPKRIPRPPAAVPSMSEPTDAVPGDLDVALRVDLSKIRAAIGDAAFELLRRGTPVGGASGDRGSESLLADAIAKSDSVVIALRPSEKEKLTDSVIVLQGRFESIDPRNYETTPRWGLPIDLGADWRRWDRPRPTTRAAPARIYAHGNEMMVFVSTAPIDSVERQLEQGADDPHVEPVEKGLLSLDARSRVFVPFLDGRAPSFARLLERSSRLRMFADLDSTEMTAEVELELDSEGAAREAADAVGEVARSAQADGGLMAKVVSGLRIEAVGNRLVARLSLPVDIVSRLVVCAGGGACDD